MGNVYRPRLVLLGTSFRAAPFAVREQVAVPPDALPETLHTLRGYVSQAVLVSTCNRTELYFISRPREGVQAAWRFLRVWRGIRRREWGRFFYLRYDLEAVRHLFRVVCGLDSQAVGEAEVLGQVRYAFHQATHLGMAAFPLDKVFQFAFQVARQARRKITCHPPSLAHIAVDRALKVVAKEAPLYALVIGAGEAATLAAHALRQRGVAQIWVANRTLARAQALAQAVDGQAVPMEQIGVPLVRADIVVASVSVRKPVLSASLVGNALGERVPSRPLCIVDMAIPRAVAPEVAAFPNITLFTLDDLKPIEEGVGQLGGEDIRGVEQVVDEGVARFARWWRTLPSLATIAALYQQGEVLRREETQRVLHFLKGLDEEGHAHLEAFSKALVRRLLQPVVEHLKENPTPSTLRRVTVLFGLERAPGAPPAFASNGVGEEETPLFTERIRVAPTTAGGGQK